MDDFQKLIESLPAKGIKIVPKQGWFWRAIDIFLKCITFGTFKDFLTNFYTTIGPRIGVPAKIYGDGVDLYKRLDQDLIAHEIYHVDKQFRKYGLGSPTVGVLPMFFLYLFLPLPVGLAYCRYKFEREAYVEGFKYSIKNGTNKADLIDLAVMQMTGSHYLWAWPFKKRVRRWFETALAGL